MLNGGLPRSLYVLGVVSWEGCCCDVFLLGYLTLKAFLQASCTFTTDVSSWTAAPWCFGEKRYVSHAGIPCTKMCMHSP